MIESRKKIRQAWDSPTLTTWMSYFVKSANLLLVLPLVLKKFESPEIAVWTLFAALLSMCSFADFGFSSTFSRLFSFAYGGVKDVIVIKTYNIENNGEPNWTLIEDISSLMRKIYTYLSLGVLFILAAFGTLFLIKPVSATHNHVQTWISWIIMCLAIVYDFYGKIYSNYLEGLYQIALVRRIETITRVGSILTSFIVLITAPTLMNLVIANAVWIVINTLRDRYLCHRVFEGKFRYFKQKAYKKDLFLKVWKPAWRSGISGLMSNGLTNLAGLIYAQVGNSAAVASYMIALRIITEIKNVSNAPFYSKIPLIAVLRAEGNIKKLIRVAKSGMRLAHIVFISGVILVGFSAQGFVNLIGSNISFVEPNLWLLMSFAFYVHRYGAMHMQLYNTTNHIIAHIADGISGIIFIAVSMLLIKEMGVYAIPVGMMSGYLGFYAWYAAYFSLRSINMSFLNFEKTVSLLPICLFLLYLLIQVVM